MYNPGDSLFNKAQLDSHSATLAALHRAQTWTTLSLSHHSIYVQIAQTVKAEIGRYCGASDLIDFSVFSTERPPTAAKPHYCTMEQF